VFQIFFEKCTKIRQVDDNVASYSGLFQDSTAATLNVRRSIVNSLNGCMTRNHEIFEIFQASFFKVSVKVSSKKTNIQILMTGWQNTAQHCL